MTRLKSQRPTHVRLQVNFSRRPRNVGTPMMLIDRILHVKVVLEKLVMSLALEILVSVLHFFRIKASAKKRKNTYELTF
jgi:hypothetical protein